jgi:hypothetical protein
VPDTILFRKVKRDRPNPLPAKRTMPVAAAEFAKSGKPFGGMADGRLLAVARSFQDGTILCLLDHRGRVIG